MTPPDRSDPLRIALERLIKEMRETSFAEPHQLRGKRWAIELQAVLKTLLGAGGGGARADQPHAHQVGSSDKNICAICGGWPDDPLHAALLGGGADRPFKNSHENVASLKSSDDPNQAAGGNLKESAAVPPVVPPPPEEVMPLATEAVWSTREVVNESRSPDGDGHLQGSARHREGVCLTSGAKRNDADAVHRVAEAGSEPADSPSPARPSLAGLIAQWRAELTTARSQHASLQGTDLGAYWEGVKNRLTHCITDLEKLAAALLRVGAAPPRALPRQADEADTLPLDDGLGRIAVSAIRAFCGPASARVFARRFGAIREESICSALRAGAPAPPVEIDERLDNLRARGILPVGQYDFFAYGEWWTVDIPDPADRSRLATMHKAAARGEAPPQ